mmetsp:Transcript_64628/g.179769  ORF Transcript_64628/g.179769 Transcript_64628/m.179769 type:complete len:370 (+) Transcript_64628:81-1190(+)
MMNLWACCSFRSNAEDGERQKADEEAEAEQDLPIAKVATLMRFQTASSFFTPLESDPDVDSCASDPEEMHPVEHMPVLRMLSRQLLAPSDRSGGLSPAPVEGPEKQISSGELGQNEVGSGDCSTMAATNATAQVISIAGSMLPGGRMTAWQLDWCTPDHVEIFLRARDGNTRKAAEILAKTLLWRETHKDVLIGSRVPCWQGDMRVLARSDDGHPMIYFCASSQPRFPSCQSTIEHMAAVLEAAVQAMRSDAATFDFVADMHGFRISSNLDPRPTVGLMDMLKQPFRDRLRHGVIVDAPRAFAALWNIAAPHMATATRKKIRFLSHAEAVHQLAEEVGAEPCRVLQDVMAGNRRNGSPDPRKLPSELID